MEGWPEKVQLFAPPVNGVPQALPLRRVQIMSDSGRVIREVTNIKSAKTLLRLKGYRPASNASFRLWETCQSECAPCVGQSSQRRTANE